MPRANFETGVKVCSKCRVEQPTRNFSFSSVRGDKLCPHCKKCRYSEHVKYRQENKEKLRARSVEFTKKNPQYYTTYARLNRQKVSPLEVFALMWRQKGKCAGCMVELHSTKKICVDHCHATGKIRGMLCHNCNVSLGFLKDNPETLQRLTAYLRA